MAWGHTGQPWARQEWPKVGTGLRHVFVERVPHRLTCQPPWRERLGRNRPGSRWIPSRGQPPILAREEMILIRFLPSRKVTRRFIQDRSGKDLLQDLAMHIG